MQFIKSNRSRYMVVVGTSDATPLPMDVFKNTKGWEDEVRFEGYRKQEDDSHDALAIVFAGNNVKDAAIALAQICAYSIARGYATDEDGQLPSDRLLFALRNAVSSNELTGAITNVVAGNIDEAPHDLLEETIGLFALVEKPTTTNEMLLARCYLLSAEMETLFLKYGSEAVADRFIVRLVERTADQI